MLNKKGYELLQLLLHEKGDDISDMDTFSYLEKNGFIGTDGKHFSYVTPLGEVACENYELKISENLTAKKAHRVSIISLILSTTIACVSLIISIFT